MGDRVIEPYLGEGNRKPQDRAWMSYVLHNNEEELAAFDEWWKSSGKEAFEDYYSYYHGVWKEDATRPH